MSNYPRGMKCLRWTEVADKARAEADIDRILFAASATRDFTDAGARARFRERWLGRYLTHDPRYTYVAFADDGAAVGYLVGCIEDPAGLPRFADIAYFASFAALTARYPAHLHINFDERARSQGFRVDARGPDKFGPFLEAEVTRWAKVISDAHITVD